MKAAEPKSIEVTKLAPNAADQQKTGDSKKAALDWRHKIAKRAAREIGDGFYINLGVGVPTIIPEVSKVFVAPRQQYSWVVSVSRPQGQGLGGEREWYPRNGSLPHRRPG